MMADYTHSWSGDDDALCNLRLKKLAYLGPCYFRHDGHVWCTKK